MWLFSQTYKKTVQIFSKLISLVIFSLVISGCAGLSINQLDSDIQKNLQMIAVHDINSRQGQLYTRELRALFHIGGKTDKKYKLTTEIDDTALSTLSVEGQSSTLKKMTLVATFSLYEKESGKKLFTDTVIGDATLGTVSSLFGQEKAESHARERLAVLLAQRVVRRLQLYFLEQG